MTEPHRQIADAFKQDESRRPAPAGLREEVVGMVMDRSARAPGAPRLLVLAAVLLAGAVIATLVGLHQLRDQPTPAGPPPDHAIPSPTLAPSATPTTRFTTVYVTNAGPGQQPGQALVALTETGLQPGQTISYRITGDVDLLYSCGSGGSGGPTYPVRGPVEFTASRTADGQGTVSTTIAIPPLANLPACPSPAHWTTVTGDWRSFVVEDTTSGVRVSAGGLNVST